MPVLESWMIVLPLCTALGCLFGSFTFRHFALGSSAILFAGMAAGAACAALAGFLIGIPVLRLRGDYLAIVTLAFGEIIKNVINVIFP